MKKTYIKPTVLIANIDIETVMGNATSVDDGHGNVQHGIPTDESESGWAGSKESSNWDNIWDD